MKLKSLVSSAVVLVAFSTNSYSDILDIDDRIVQGSQCIGTDCVNGESFAFSTLILKENNLRIKFNDTSNSGSFPNNDWQISINDTINGGENYFAVENITSSTMPMKISSDGSVSLGENNAFLLSASGDLTIRGTLSDSSDVNLKENFKNVESSIVLDKITNLPITTWNYKGDSANQRHIGAMAQDFYKSFEFGPDNLHISPRDVAFVSMVGVKELVEQNRIKDEKIKDLEKRIKELESLEKSIKNLETMVKVLLNPAKDKTVSLAE